MQNDRDTVLAGISWEKPLVFSSLGNLIEAFPEFATAKPVEMLEQGGRPCFIDMGVFTFE